MSVSKNSERLHMLMAFTGNAIFGFSFLFSKLALNVAEPFVLLAARFSVAFLLMTVLMVTGLVKCDLKGKDIKPLIILGLWQPVVYFICESYGIKFTSSSFSGTIIALVPIMGILLGVFILREKPTLVQILFSILSVAGVIVMTVTDDMGSGFQWKGFVLLLGAVLAAAMFSIQSRSIADQFTSFERTYVMFGLGTVVFVVMALLRTGLNMGLWMGPLTNGGFWISIVYLSCVSSVGAFLLLNKALDVLPVARSLVFANVTTVISVLAGVFILHEHFTPVQIVGIAMVLIGIYGVNRE
ncbi:MAG: DMT family transporter [Clostridiales bacterium]|nr:DMT family transporter [Candidatus Blautia equi]